MEISENFRRVLLSELDFVVRKMREETDLTRKIYFFSAAYGVVERVMRYSMDNELLIAHTILNICYNAYNDRINRIRAGDSTVVLPDNWSERLAENLSRLKEFIQENKPIYPALEEIARLTYLASGAGYYVKNYLESLQAR